MSLTTLHPRTDRGLHAAEPSPGSPDTAHLSRRSAHLDERPGHDAIGIYEPCRCEPGDDNDYESTHFIVEGFVTCDRALLFTVCATCCVGDERRCREDHDHRVEREPCPGTGTDRVQR